MTVTTKYGTAVISDRGYYRISSTKEGNCGKYLHRLIFEDFYKVCLLDDSIIHHKDENRLNNDIDNLELMSREKHVRLHHKGKIVSKETGDKLRRALKGKKQSFDSKLKSSKKLTKDPDCNYFRVSKHSDKRKKQGFLYRYQYYGKDGKRHCISSISIENLKEKVLAKGLEWYEWETPI